MRKKLTTAKISMWNIDSLSVMSHADEAHKSILLVDMTVKIGDEDTARDLLNGLGHVLDHDENVRDYLRDLILSNPIGLVTMARTWLAANMMRETND